MDISLSDRVLQVKLGLSCVSFGLAATFGQYATQITPRPVSDLLQ